MSAVNEQRTKYCHTCKRSGQDTSKCRNSQTTRRPAIPNNVPVCHHCNRRGHTRRNCFLVNGPPTNGLNNHRQVTFTDESRKTNYFGNNRQPVPTQIQWQLESQTTTPAIGLSYVYCILYARRLFVRPFVRCSYWPSHIYDYVIPHCGTERFCMRNSKY